MSKKMGIFVNTTFEWVVLTRRIGDSKSKMSTLAESLLMTLNICGKDPGFHVMDVGGVAVLLTTLGHPNIITKYPNIFQTWAFTRGGGN